MSFDEKIHFWGPKNGEQPGEYPFTHGVYPNMYTGRLWTMNINKNDIESIDFAYEELVDDWFDSTESDNRFFFGDEQLIDMWFDPTGNVLSANTVYVSGKSVAYGLIEKFHISLRYWDFVMGNVNIRPKYQFYKSGSLEKMITMSVGGHYFMNGAVPHKYEYKGSSCVGDETSASSDECFESDGFWNWSEIRTEKSSYEIFLALTSSMIKPSGKGRMNVNAGMSIATIENNRMPRYWVGFDSDVRQSLKLIGLLAYDEYFATTYELLSGEEKNDIILDFGFIYAWSEQFRVGVHLTRPFLGFYWKF